MRSRKKLERSNAEALTELAVLGGIEGCDVSGLIRTRGTCPMCGNLIGSDPSGYAFLNGGALPIHSKMEGFLFFGFHGTLGGDPPNQSAEISIAHHAPSGQFELFFCSSACLRLFLNRCVDEVEERLRKRRESLP